MHNFEGRAHVIIEAPYESRTYRVRDPGIVQMMPDSSEVRLANSAQVIQNRGQFLDDGLVLGHFTIEHAQRVRFGPPLAVAAHGCRYAPQRLPKDFNVLRAAVHVAD